MFVCSVVILAATRAVAEPPATLTVGGQVSGALTNVAWQVYSATNPSLSTSGLDGDAENIFWDGDVGSLEPSIGLGSELICALSQETSSGTSNHAGYYSVMNHTLTGDDPAVFAAMTLRPIPIPFVTSSPDIS